MGGKKGFGTPGEADPKSMTLPSRGGDSKTWEDKKTGGKGGEEQTGGKKGKFRKASTLVPSMKPRKMGGKGGQTGLSQQVERRSVGMKGFEGGKGEKKGGN